MPDKRFDVRGRTAIITGGSDHLGRAMAACAGYLGHPFKIRDCRGVIPLTDQTAL